MPASPINFATTDTNPTKLFGGNVLEVPSDYTPVPTNYWVYQWKNFDALFTTWIKPQVKNWKLRGANIMRHIGAVEGVLLGTYTQAYYESKVAAFVAECRAQGVMVSLCSSGVPDYYASGLTDAQWRAAGRDSINSLIVNVLVPNQDIVAYYEAGTQESAADAASQSLTAYLATEARKVTTIPLLVSSYANNFKAFNGVPAITLYGHHHYKDDATLQTAMDSLRVAFNASDKPILAEEGGFRGPGAIGQPHTDQQKADYLRAQYLAMWGHPQCAGIMQWGGQGPTFDGDWQLWGPPSTSDLDPAATWPDTLASTFLRNWGTANRNLKLPLAASGGTVTGTAAPVPLSWAPGNVTTAAEPNAVIRTVLYKAGTPLKLSGTITLAAASPGTYRLTLVGDKNYSPGTVTLGSADLPSGGAQAFSIPAFLPVAEDWTFRLVAQRVGGTADATITALSATLEAGSAARRPLRRADGKLLLRADSKPILTAALS